MADGKYKNNKHAENVEKELRKLEEKEKNKSVCPYCSRNAELVWVHGHYQCQFCKNVVVSCCGDG